jgi:hypothetical protein
VWPEVLEINQEKRRKKMDATRRKLNEMLKENTGIHMLDSGGAYGRHWQRNQERNFEDEPEVFLEFTESGIEVTHNLYHWLAERLTYDPEMDDKFQKFSELPENAEKNWFENVEDFLEEIGAENVDTINTYNREDALSQTIQYTRFTVGDTLYILLMVHGGCDVRGNYSTPVVFTENEPYLLFDNARAMISCNQSDVDPDQLLLPSIERHDYPHDWITENAGYSWEPEDSAFAENLESYEISKNEEDSGKGKIYVDEDGNGYCPICGSRLNAYAY